MLKNGQKLSTALRCKKCSRLPWGRGARRRCLCHGMNLDVGCGNNPQPGFIGMDRRDTGRVDIVWDIESVGQTCPCTPPRPWPIPDGVVDKLLLSHLVEHLKPWCMIAIMDECWRVMNPDGQCLIATPYAGSAGFWQDPTHTKGWNEATPAYFDPTHQSLLWNVYRPRPWRIVRCHHSPFHNMEIVLEPIKAPLCCKMCGRENIPLDRFEDHWGPCYRRYKGIEDRANECAGK